MEPRCVCTISLLISMVHSSQSYLRRHSHDKFYQALLFLSTYLRISLGEGRGNEAETWCPYYDSTLKCSFGDTSSPLGTFLQPAYLRTL